MNRQSITADSRGNSCGRRLLDRGRGRLPVELIKDWYSPGEVAELLGGLKRIRVNVIGLDDDNRGEIGDRVGKLSAELDEQGWERIVTARNGKDDVNVFLKMRDQEAVEGIVVTVLQGNSEAVFINVVGDIRPEQIATLGERFDIEPLKKAGLAIHKS